jgi:hypothetical protein
MNRFASFVGGVAALGLSTSALAQPATCITEAEATASFAYALPEVLQSVANKCSQTLPASSFLTTKGKELAGSYRQGSATHWPLAKAAFFKIGGAKNRGSEELMAAMPDSALQAIVTTAINVELVKGIKATDCQRIDTLVSALAPLPVLNISTLLVQVMAMAGSSKANDFNICPKS